MSSFKTIYKTNFLFASKLSKTCVGTIRIILADLEFQARIVIKNLHWGEAVTSKAPSRRKHKGRRAEHAALENFVFFGKNNLILGAFW